MSGESDDDDIDPSIAAEADEASENTKGTGNDESTNTGIKTVIVTEPYYYSNPFGVNSEQYYRS